MTENNTDTVSKLQRTFTQVIDEVKSRFESEPAHDAPSAPTRTAGASKDTFEKVGVKADETRTCPPRQHPHPANIHGALAAAGASDNRATSPYKKSSASAVCGVSGATSSRMS